MQSIIFKIFSMSSYLVEAEIPWLRIWPFWLGHLNVVFAWKKWIQKYYARKIWNKNNYFHSSQWPDHFLFPWLCGSFSFKPVFQNWGHLWIESWCTVSPSRLIPCWFPFSSWGFLATVGLWKRLILDFVTLWIHISFQNTSLSLKFQNYRWQQCQLQIHHLSG